MAGLRGKMLFEQLLNRVKFFKKKELETKPEVELEDIVEQVLYEIPNSEVKRPMLKTLEQTMEFLINTNSSIARFGNGEISIIQGKNAPCQKFDENLAKRLKEILQETNQNLAIGINREYYYPNFNKLLPDMALFFRGEVPKFRKHLSSYIRWDKEYCAANFTQTYMFFENYDFETHYRKLRQIWDNKKILIVTSESAINNVLYNIYENAQKIDYLYIPSKNAYAQYEQIYSSIKKYDTDTLIILMAGPMAKVLADDLSKENYRALDFGYLMKDYDWYKRKKTRNWQDIVEFISR